MLRLVWHCNDCNDCNYHEHTRYHSTLYYLGFDKFYPDGNVRKVASEDYNKLQVGFIAQEVKAVIDEIDAENNIVSIDDDGFHRMDYEKIVVPLVKAVQEQQEQIDELRAQIKSLIAIQTQTPSKETMTESDQ